MFSPNLPSPLSVRVLYAWREVKLANHTRQQLLLCMEEETMSCVMPGCNLAQTCLGV
jgi:hypothetical protein